MRTRRPDLAVFVASLFHGGVGKMRVNLVNEFARRGYCVDLLLADMDSPYMDQVSPEVRVVDVKTSNALTGLPFLGAYLLRARPRVLLAQRVRVNALALRARALTGVDTRVYATVNTNMTRELEALRPEKRVRHLALMRRYFPRNEAVIAISQGVAEDFAQIMGWPVERLTVAPNPVVTPELYRLAEEPLEHPWFVPGQPPVILGVGRLEPQKDFPTLIRAFAALRARRPCRLIILGEGGRRRALEALAAELGVSEDVELPGFKTNPYAYLARAALFAFSSRWEGFGNALAEAMALGTPVVSTDCPSGPREILEGGRHGPLVPVGDVAGMSAAMERLLEQPPAGEALRAAAARYTLERSASAYLQAMGLDPSGPAGG